MGHSLVRLLGVEGWTLNPVLPSSPPLAGNNAVEMQTTAAYDPTTQEFIIHSPTTLSQASGRVGAQRMEG